MVISMCARVFHRGRPRQGLPRSLRLQPICCRVHVQLVSTVVLYLLYSYDIRSTRLEITQFVVCLFVSSSDLSFGLGYILFCVKNVSLKDSYRI